MQLDEFVKSALVQVAKGVHEASEDVSELGGSVNPLLIKGLQGFQEADATDIKFDVALIVSESLTGEAGAKISVASFFRANGSVKDTDSYQQTSKVQFSVPLRLPSGEDKVAKNAEFKGI